MAFTQNQLFDVIVNFNNSAIFLTAFTNIFITIYVGIDALIALKIMYTTYSLYLISVLF
jgi:hypothetical protein